MVVNLCAGHRCACSHAPDTTRDNCAHTIRKQRLMEWINEAGGGRHKGSAGPACARCHRLCAVIAHHLPGLDTTLAHAGWSLASPSPLGPNWCSNCGLRSFQTSECRASHQRKWGRQHSHRRLQIGCVRCRSRNLAVTKDVADEPPDSVHGSINSTSACARCPLHPPPHPHTPTARIRPSGRYELPVQNGVNLIRLTT